LIMNNKVWKTCYPTKVTLMGDQQLMLAAWNKCAGEF
jgi:hypothetical protein